MDRAGSIAAAGMAWALMWPIGTALASDAEIEQLKRENAQMKAMMMDMQKQLDAVARQVEDAQRALKDEAAKGPPVRSAGDELTIATTGGGLRIKSGSGHSFRILGRLFLDHDSYDRFWGSNAEENKIRRAQLVLKGGAGRHWSYLMAANIRHETQQAFLGSVYLKYADGPWFVKIGRDKRPILLEDRTSINWASTIERSLLFDFAGPTLRDRPEFGGIEAGFASKGFGVPMSALIGFYDNEEEEADGSDVYGFGARWSIAPSIGENGLLHAGATLYDVDLKGSDFQMETSFGINAGAEAFRTGVQATGGIDLYGLELAYLHGPFSLQGEYLDIDSDGFGQGFGMEMDGFYAQASYVLTGESRGYQYKGGMFTKIHPKHDYGAWEVVARWEDAGVDIPGRALSADLERLVLGVNWEAAASVRFMLNYVMAELDGCYGTVRVDGQDQGTSFAACTPGDGNAWSLRGQYVF